MNRIDLTDTKFHIRLTATLDAALNLIAVTSILYTSQYGWNFCGILILTDALLTAGIRWWLMYSFGIAFNTSWLNVILKKIADVVISLFVLFLILPIAIVVALPVIKVAKSGPILCLREMSDHKGGTIKGLVFRYSGSVFDNIALNRLPMVTNVLLFQTSVSEIYKFEEKDNI